MNTAEGRRSREELSCSSDVKNDLVVFQSQTKMAVSFTRLRAPKPIEIECLTQRGKKKGR